MITSMRGYTVFEVMIVLSVTAVIFFTAVTMFSGRQARTQFSQAMYDLQSKIQSYSTQVSTGTFPGATSYTCKIRDNGSASYWRAYLDPGTTTQSTNTNCIYLGKAIQVPGVNSTAFYTYDVLGLRLNHKGDLGCNDSSNNQPATSVAQACPEPAINSARDTYLLLDKYSLITGVKVLSAKYYSSPTGSGQEAEILELYQSFQGASQGMTAYTVVGTNAYPPLDSVAPGATVDPGFKQCIEGLYDVSYPTDINCPNPVMLGVGGNSWHLCLQDSALSNQKAELILSGASSGITTRLNMATACT